jgi:hypothetical protein
MVGLRSDRKSEAEEVVECALDPKCPGQGGRRNAIGYTQLFGNRSIIFASCAPSGRQLPRPPQWIVGRTDGT